MYVKLPQDHLFHKFHPQFLGRGLQMQSTLIVNIPQEGAQLFLLYKI